MGFSLICASQTPLWWLSQTTVSLHLSGNIYG
jgi:hypothetical protein